MVPEAVLVCVISNKPPIEFPAATEIDSLTSKTSEVLIAEVAPMAVWPTPLTVKFGEAIALSQPVPMLMAVSVPAPPPVILPTLIPVRVVAAVAVAVEVGILSEVTLVMTPTPAAVETVGNCKPLQAQALLLPVQKLKVGEATLMPFIVLVPPPVVAVTLTFETIFIPLVVVVAAVSSEVASLILRSTKLPV